MIKDKIKIINLNLGISITDDQIHPETKQKIQNTIQIIQKEKKVVVSLIKKRQQKRLQKAAQKCLKQLVEAQPRKIDAQDLLKESGIENLSSLIQAINRYIKNNYRNTIILKKSRTNNKTNYYVIVH